MTKLKKKKRFVLESELIQILRPPSRGLKQAVAPLLPPGRTCVRCWAVVFPRQAQLVGVIIEKVVTFHQTPLLVKIARHQETSYSRLELIRSFFEFRGIIFLFVVVVELAFGAPLVPRVRRAHCRFIFVVRCGKVENIRPD